MLNIIYGYIFKYTRKKNSYSLQKESDLSGIDFTYLSKVENGKIIPSDRIFDSFVKHFYINVQPQLELETYINCCIKKISKSEFRSEKDQLDKVIKENTNSIYIPYLHLLLCAYNIGQEEYDENFYEIIDSLKQCIDQFTDEYKRFFYIYYCQYLIKKHDVKSYETNYKILKSIQNDQWKPMELYGQIIYYFHLNDLPKVIYELECLQEALMIEDNKTLLNALYSLYASYYLQFNDYQKAISYHLKSMEYWNKTKDLSNYGTSAWNIAWIYMLQKDYQSAIEYWNIAIKYQYNETVCFNLAWCYYSMNLLDKAIDSINKSKSAATVDQYHFEFIKWLKYHIKEEYSLRSSKQLKQIYNDYFDTMTKDMQKFLLIALIKQAKHDQNHDDYYKYTDILINANVNSSITL